MQINWNKIRHLMVDKGIRSDAQLARGAGVHPNTMGKVGGFRSETVDRIAKFLGCSPFELISVDNLTPPTAPAKRRKAE